MKDIYRTTKCFGVNGQGKIKGAFPKGFMKWIESMGWTGKERCYLCAGLVEDQAIMHRLNMGGCRRARVR